MLKGIKFAYAKHSIQDQSVQVCSVRFRVRVVIFCVQVKKIQ